MKRFFVVLFSLALLAASAIPCSAVGFSCAVPAVKGGQKAELALRVDEGSELYTAEFLLTYDESAYRFTGEFAPGEACEKLAVYLHANEIEPGTVKVIYTAAEPLTEGGAFCTLVFRAKRSAQRGDFDLIVEHAETFDGEHIRKLPVTADGTQGAIEPAASPLLIAGITLIVIGLVLCVTALVIKIKKGKAAAE